MKKIKLFQQPEPAAAKQHWAMTSAAALAIVLSSPAHAMSITGEARDPRTEELLYFESHRCVSDGVSCSVEYLDTQSKPFAEKALDYSSSKVAPRVHFNDFRHDVEITVDPDPVENMVVDAGFDNYVRSQWEALEAGNTVRFNFLVAGRDSPLSMKAEPRADCASSQLCIDVGLSGWFLGMLVDPIQLIYDRTTRRLLRFTGVSNIPTEERKSQKVRIDYTYGD